MIYINDGINNLNIVMNLNGKVLSGYKFSTSKVESIGKEALDYFDIFKLSESCTKISSGDYDIYLDNETNFKHYFKNGKEDYKMFFLNNGENACLYKGIGDDYKAKVYDLITAGLCALSITILMNDFLVLANNLERRDITVENLANYAALTLYEPFSDYNNKDITLDYVKDKIYSSEYLTLDEKNYLYNEELFEDVLPYINSSEHLKYMLDASLRDIKIAAFGEKNPDYRLSNGYYLNVMPNTLFIKDYENLERSKDTLSHEFVHLLQAPEAIKYNLLVEATAEIVSSEYFDYSYETSYKEPVKLVKKLMEIIGPERVEYFVFTGDFSLIEEKVKPYLSSFEYLEFLSDLRINSITSNSFISNEKKYESLERLLDKLYYCVYGKDIKDDEIINAIDSDNTLIRYYFNKRKINEENSFYKISEVVELRIEEAIKIGVIDAYESVKEYSPFKIDEFQKIDIDYSGITVIERKTIYEMEEKRIKSCVYVTCIIDGTKYENVLEQELINMGLLELRYSKTIDRKLTYEDYINHNYKGYLHFTANYGEIIDDKVIVTQYKNVYIPTIYERNDEFVKKYKNK